MILKHTIIASAIGMTLTLLTGCNNSDQALEITPKQTEQPDSGQLALRNMATDLGNQISTPDAVNVPDAEGVSNLIDGDSNSKFLSFSPAVTIVFSSESAKVVKGYRIVSANDQPMRDPATWTFEGSNDQETWVELDNQSNQEFSSRGQSKQFDLTANEQSFSHYRLKATHKGTDDFGADIIQIAELELLVKADKPLIAFKTDKHRAAVGEKVFFLDQSLAGPTAWQWTFEDGTPATSTEQHPTVTFNSLGSKQVTLTASNDKGENTLTQTQAIWIWDPQQPWAGFPQPEVTLVKNDPEHPGQVALDNVMTDLVEQIHQISLGVSKILYNDVTEINLFKTVTFETGHYDYPAAKGGTATDMILTMDLGHILAKAEESDQALRDEVLGMLWHELTHGYQSVPLTGQYAAGNEYHTFLESVADFVRIKAGYNEHKRPGVKWVNSWNDDAYNQTSFFLEWVHNTNQTQDFIKQFNAVAKTLNPWSFDGAFKHIFGEDKGIEYMWHQYQTEYLQKVLGLEPPYPTPVTGYINFAIDEGNSVTTNATDIGVWGEGVDAIVDNNVTIKFNGVIEAPWWIPEYLPQLMPINEVDTVNIDFELPEPVALHKYSVTTGNDNPLRDPTAWAVLASNDGQDWHELANDQYPAAPERLTTYHFDLDNDAAYPFYRFIFENTRQGDGVGGDNGRLVQIGELALLTLE